MFLFQRRQSRNLYPKLISGNSIRILTILPGTWGEPIKCDLRETQLQDSGPYKALSYTWTNGEDDDRLVQITCNKLSIKVSSNLHSALRQLRHDSDPVKLWVDSICINQENNSERTCQVGIMRDIYARSTEVVIWLGESGPKDHLGEMILPMLTAGDSASLYQWHGDGRDLPKLRAYVSKETEERRQSGSAQDTVDVFGAFYVLHALISGVDASGIQELRHFSKSGPILKGFEALMQQRWVSSSVIASYTGLIDVILVVSGLGGARSCCCAECNDPLRKVIGPLESFLSGSVAVRESPTTGKCRFRLPISQGAIADKILAHDIRN